MQTHVWRNLHIELPDDWEMLQFSRQAAAGRCGFADRHQFRLELVWRAVEGPPDLDRMMSDYQAKLQSDAEGAQVQRIAARSWPGITARMGDTATSRFGGYLPAEGCVVEIVFLRPGSRDAALEAGVLDSVRAEPARADGSRRWRACGMDLLASKGLPLAACRAEPARVTMLFAEDGGVRQERFQRLGFVSEWLEGTVGDWLAAQVPKRGRIRSQSSVHVHGHKVALLAGTRPIQRLGGLITRPAPLEAAAWLCPQDGRLYCVSITGRGSHEGERLPAGRLSCCDLLELSQ